VDGLHVYVTSTLVRTEAFVVNEAGGSWGRAQILPGVTTLDRDGDSQGAAVACWSAEHCAAGGFFERQGSTRPYPFADTQG
jgi:hypothetical protein